MERVINNSIRVKSRSIKYELLYCSIQFTLSKQRSIELTVSFLFDNVIINNATNTSLIFAILTYNALTRLYTKNL